MDDDAHLEIFDQQIANLLVVRVGFGFWFLRRRKGIIGPASSRADPGAPGNRNGPEWETLDRHDFTERNEGVSAPPRGDGVP